MFSKKILIISNNPVFGGGEYYISEILSILEQYEDVQYLVKDQILFDKLNKNSRKIFSFSSNTFFAQLKELKKVIKIEQPYIVLLNGGRTLFFAPFLSKSKIIVIRHSTNRYAVCRIPSAFIQFLYRTLYICLLHIVYFFPDIIIHVSNYSMKEQKLFKNKAVCIRNGLHDVVIDEKREKLPIRFLFLGRTDISKGIDIIVNAFQKIPNNIASIDIVGTGTYDDRLMSINRTNIIYHGFQNDTDKYYQNCDVFILLSEYENCPFGIIDALRYGMPVITTGVGGISEMVFNNVNGLIIPKTTEAMTEAIEKLVNNPKMILEMGKKSRQIFERNYTIDRVITQLTGIINKL
jgi:glycosyltransferase involved in cell wall biosynthesis